MHPASYAEWIALIERYRRAVRAYTEAVQSLVRAGGLPGSDYDAALKKVEQTHQVCEKLREALKVYSRKDITSGSLK
ncbi:MAG TPA: hypothetical protein VKX39_12275 [Bryobacteraceae bacterium]|nr:hypothetical protein [Bryobacteraceae bacterium]